jgi:hypothetical protein
MEFFTLCFMLLEVYRNHVVSSSFQFQRRTPNKTTDSYGGVRTGQLRRKCACGGIAGPTGECEECRRKRLSVEQKAANLDGRKKTGFEAPSIVHEALKSPGQPLDGETRAFFEPRFGHDFGKVRVHTDRRAAESALAIHALAYTVGRDVVFAEGRFAPKTEAGKLLLAHELFHTLQQRTASPSQSLSVGGVSEHAESEAEHAAAKISGEGFVFRPTPQTAVIARKKAPDYKYRTADLHAVPDWNYIAYLEQEKVLLRYYNSGSKIEIGTIGWVTNNPGNIDYAFPNDPNAGAAAREASRRSYEKNPAETLYHRFAIFPTRAAGIQAILPVLGKYVESNPDSTVEQAIKRFKGSEKDFSDFKLLFPGEPMPKTDEEKKVAVTRVQQAYADAVRAHMRAALKSEDKSLSDDAIQKRVENIMTRKFSELKQGDDNASLLRRGLVEKEGGLRLPGVEFTCKGFTSINPIAYPEAAREKIVELVSKAEAVTELKAVLNCDGSQKKPIKSEQRSISRN